MLYRKDDYLSFDCILSTSDVYIFFLTDFFLLTICFNTGLVHFVAHDVCCKWKYGFHGGWWFYKKKKEKKNECMDKYICCFSVYCRYNSLEYTTHVYSLSILPVLRLNLSKHFLCCPKRKENGMNVNISVSSCHILNAPCRR